MLLFLYKLFSTTFLIYWGFLSHGYFDSFPINSKYCYVKSTFLLKMTTQQLSSLGKPENFKMRWHNKTEVFTSVFMGCVEDFQGSVDKSARNIL